MTCIFVRAMYVRVLVVVNFMNHTSQSCTEYIICCRHLEAEVFLWEFILFYIKKNNSMVMRTLRLVIRLNDNFFMQTV